MDIIKKLFEFASLGSMVTWYGRLDQLATLAIPEDWSYKNPSPDKKNKKTPILENYIIHTFRRLACEYNDAEEKDRGAIICFFEDKACFNTGLFTNQYQYIYAMFRKNTNQDKQPWFLVGFADDSDPFFRGVDKLPRRARYFNDIKDLIFDTSAELRVNSAHILRNPENIKRLPEGLRESKFLPTLFTGAVDLAKKKVEANYKAAVPQFYDDQICFLLPICLQNPETADVSLAVRWHDGYYTGHTCLTLDMAYNNARLIACPNSDWLKP